MRTRATTAAYSGIAPIVGCALLTAAGANIAARLPYTPVPVTFQTAAVFFAGLVLGSRRALASQLLYLAVGFAGAPVFAFGGHGPLYPLNPFGTGGFLLSLPLAAWVVGAIAERGAPALAIRGLGACMAGIGVVYGVGCAWLAAWLHLPVGEAVLRGAGAFLLWDVAKALLVLAAAQAVRRRSIGA